MQLVKAQPAPAFRLEDQNGTAHSLEQYRGRWVVLYFYPKDDTPGCTTEACSFRDTYQDIIKTGAVVLGVSADQIQSHKNFAEKYSLPFPLLADPNRLAIDSYGASSVFGTRRISFLIDPNGLIAKIYPKVRPADHAREVIEDIKALQNTPAKILSG